MRVLHISAECYPAAKAGGLGDVVGALPKYQNQSGIAAGVVIPKYDLPWIRNRPTEVVYSGAFRMANGVNYPFAVEQTGMDNLGFSLFFVNIPGQFDRQGIYGDAGGWFGDNEERFVFFQQAVLQWVLQFGEKPDLLHCHDHHSGLIPFMVKYCPDYHLLKDIPTVFTIHNGEYQGALHWDKYPILPAFYTEASGLLDWNGHINSLACAIKCAWAVTTVSQSYMEELAYTSNGLEPLIRDEWPKCRGILNGIDAQVWDPQQDSYLPVRLATDVDAFKQENKNALFSRFQFQEQDPVFTFIGRLVREKGADLLPGLIRQVLDSGLAVNFLILGTGEAELHDALRELNWVYRGRCDAVLEYNEALAHTLYAGSDFLLMPSRVEPCGLNQMYAMRYGTIPIVRTVGGLKDTVIDLGAFPSEGRGFRFDHFTVDDAHHAIWRAYNLYQDNAQMKSVRKRIMAEDFSWEKAANNYFHLYQELV